MKQDRFEKYAEVATRGEEVFNEKRDMITIGLGEQGLADYIKQINSVFEAQYSGLGSYKGNFGNVLKIYEKNRVFNVTDTNNFD